MMNVTQLANITNKRIALVVTGSVAAVKTFLLAGALQGQGFVVDIVATETGRSFLKETGPYAVTKEQLGTVQNITPDILNAADVVLVSPASAEALRRIAQGDLSYGREDALLIVVPAMNALMWKHPAVQGNVRKALQKGVTVLSPVYGAMACGDFGYGRLPEVRDIAAAVVAVLQGTGHALIDDLAKALFETPLLPQKVPQAVEKILLVSWNGDGVFETVKYWQDRGVEVQCVLPEETSVNIAALEALTGNVVCCAHYRIYPESGMEHIWLAEDVDVVVMDGVPSVSLGEMASGSGVSFIGCIYLASKRPVVMSLSKACDLVDIKQVENHGVFIVKSDVFTAVSGLPVDASILTGKRFLVLGGAPRETVDTFRFYLNTARGAIHGGLVAKGFRTRGANVEYMQVDSVRGVLDVCAGSDKNYDAVIQLANVSQITSSAPADHKISKTGVEQSRLFDVVGNVDIKSELQSVFGVEKVAGYDNYQNWFAPEDMDALAQIKSMVRRCDKQNFKAQAVADKTITRRVLVTTGRTVEKITTDGVVITNGFTGQQGQEIARCFAARGYAVTLVSGPTVLPRIDHPLVYTVDVVSMAEMRDVVMAEIETPQDIYISVAAISDFKVDVPFDLKLSPTETLKLNLQENESLIEAVVQSNHRPSKIVSFAAQSPENVVEYATRKFEKLGVEMTVANPIGGEAATSRDTSRNDVYFIMRKGGETVCEHHGEDTKAGIAAVLVDRIIGI